MVDTNKTAGSTGAACRQCGLPLPPQKRGRPRIYCSASCRQQAYEKRHDIEPWKQRWQPGDGPFGGLEANADASAMNHVKRQMAAASRRARRDPNATFTSVENVQRICRSNPEACIEVVTGNPLYAAAVVDHLADIIWHNLPQSVEEWKVCAQSISRMCLFVELLNGAVVPGPTGETNPPPVHKPTLSTHPKDVGIWPAAFRKESNGEQP